MNTTMKAMVYTKYGSPDVLQLKEVVKPVPTDNEVLIQVHATTVEAADALFRLANNFATRVFTGPLKPKFTMPGSEFAGEIEAVGNAVTRYKVGDQVFGTTAPSFGTDADYI